jgi:type IV secretion system protein VirB4
VTRIERAGTLNREREAAERVPYVAQVSEHVVKTTFGDYLQVFRLEGSSFESADDAVVNAWHERLNVLWRNVASPGLALWTHVVRRAAQLPEDGRTGPGFANRLRARYQRRLGGEALMVNELYLAVVYRPSAGVGAGLLARVLSRAEPRGSRLELEEALDACAKLAQTLSASLARYEPRLLGTYRIGSRPYSEILEYLGLLINGEWQRMPLPRGPLSAQLVTSRLLFGTEALEYRLPAATRVGALLGIKEYPTPTVAGMYDRLLSAPFPFVLTQSFAFLSRAAGQTLLQRQYHRMENAGDFAVSQAEELKSALDALSSNEFVMGEHHLSLQVLGDLPEGRPSDPPGRRLKTLNDHVALARTLLADTGMTVAREDLALEAAFWAQLPGNFALRPRKAPISSRNFSAMAPLHNYPVGRASGNHWGEALTLLTTSARSPYHFSLHASDPREPDGGSRRDTGHTLICGPTGSGKTVLIGFLVTMLARAGATQVLFDKDRGLEILVRGLGGDYLPLRNGEPTGFNPLRLPVGPLHLEFQKSWLRALARPPGGGAPTTREEADLDQALHGTLALDPDARRLSRLIEFLDRTDAEGLHARLARWCAGTGGDYAWVFDGDEDSVAPRLAGAATVGFDVTDFLGNETIRTPVTLYLFHLVRSLLDGRRMVCWMDEFWRLLGDPAFVAFAKDGPKTWRKLNGVMCLATQSVSDVLASPIARTLIEQTPTKILFPSPEANALEYCEGLGLGRREFELIHERLEPGSRRFLVKQGHDSVVCELDLRGFDAELAVISGRTANLALMENARREKGADPEHWLPEFLRSLGPHVIPSTSPED